MEGWTSICNFTEVTAEPVTMCDISCTYGQNNEPHLSSAKTLQDAGNQTCKHLQRGY